MPACCDHYSQQQFAIMLQLCVIVLVCFPSWAYGVGIKRRLADAASAESEQPRAAEARADELLRRGGVRQRVSRETPADDVHSERGPLNEYLKEQWAKGSLNTGQVQQIALKATQQGAVGAERMGNIGTQGLYSNNLFRALKTILGMPAGAPDFHWAEIPLRGGGKEPHPFFLPHEFFASFLAGCKTKWMHAVHGPAGAPQQFWKAIEQSTFVKQHPALKPDLFRWTIPIGLHGDGGAFSKQDQLYVISWNSLLGSGSTIQKRFICTVVRKCDMTAATLDAMFDVLAWSFNVLLTGRTPILDMRGKHVRDGGATLAANFRH
jgi:hypothetical protein